MEAWIRVENAVDTVTEYAALMAWLNGDRELRGRVRGIARPPADGELGGVLDVVAVSLGSGGVCVALAQVLAEFVRNRRTDVEVTVERDKKKTKTVSVKANRAADALEILEKILSNEDES
jgi:hypothetical protein